MALTYKYTDGFGEELTVSVNPSNVLLTTHDTVSGDTVVTHLSMHELKQLSEFVKSAIEHVEDD